MITISNSLVVKFYQQDAPNGQRLGQRMHTYFKLDKVTNPEDKVWADRLYEAEGRMARIMLDQVTDYTQ